LFDGDQCTGGTLIMNLIFTVIAGLFILAGNPGEPLKKDVEAAISIYEKALKNKDAPALDGILADNFILTTASGKILKKKDMLANLARQDTKYEAFETTGVELRILENTAIETGKVRTKGTRSGKLFSETTLYTDVWVREKNQWKLLAEHSSFVKE
jgi:ketosteroid isomerase-like protein